jgi:predicted PurR-regulated permease PerM
MAHMHDQRPITIAITPSTMFVGVVIVLGFVLAYVLRDLLWVILTAVVLASAVEAPTARMVRWGMSRVLAVALLYLTVVVFLSAVFYFVVPPVLREANSFLTELPTYLETFNLTSIEGLPTKPGDGSALLGELAPLQSLLKSTSSGILGAASSVFGGLMSFVLIVVLSFYLAVLDQGIDDFLRIVTPMRHHTYILGLWRRAQRKIGRWFQGQLLLSVIIGVMIYIGLLILGVPHPALLALIAGILELIPVFGSILSAVPAVAVATIAGGASLALLTIAMYVVVNQLEGNVIYPLVVQKVLGVSPLVVILAIIAGAQVGGFLGILIAVPVAAAVQEYVNDVQKGKRGGEEEDTPTPPAPITT